MKPTLRRTACGRPAPATLAGLGLLLAAALLAFFSLDREVDFDEAYYLILARSIGRTGLPLVTAMDDLRSRQLFITSPPLVMAVAAVTEALWPGHPFPSRLVHVLVFTLPVYFLVWYIAWREYGPVPACFALVALLGSVNFLAHGCFVRLDVPLATCSLLSLWCVHMAARPGARATRWSLVAGLSLAAAVLAKYQAVCIPVAIGFYLGWLALRRDEPALSRMVRPLAFQVCGGLVALALLYGYFNFTPGSDVARYGGGVAGAMDRIGASAETPISPGLRLMAVGWLGLIFLGWGFLPAILGLLPGRADGRFAALMACYCVAVALFNLGAFRMPGAGGFYLLAMIPPLAILVGRAAAVVLEPSRGPRTAPLVTAIVVLLGCQFYQARPWRVPLAAKPVSRYAQVARYVETTGPAGCGVLADCMAVEYFSDHPTGLMPYMAYPALRAYLAGEGSYPVGYVALRQSWLQQPPPALAPHWDEVLGLLRREFEPAPAGIDGIVLLARQPPGPRRDGEVKAAAKGSPARSGQESSPVPDTAPAAAESRRPAGATPGGP
jgi:hypothetical protein